MDKPTPNRLLDLPAGQGIVGSSIRWDLVSDGANAGQIHPVVGGNMTNDPTASVCRTVRGLRLTPSDYAAIDLFADRVRVWWVLADGTEWSLGVFAFVDPTEEETTAGTSVTVSLYDRWLDLDQPVTHSVSVPPGGVFTDTMRALVIEAGIEDTSGLQPSGNRALDPLNWPIGTGRGRIIRELAELAGHLPPYFDRDGVFTSRGPDKVTESWGHRYDLGAGSRVVRGSVRRPRKSVDAAGQHVVVSNGPTNGPIVGTATVDPSSPLHPQRRRSVRTEVHQVQGIASTDAANRLAAVYAAKAAIDYDTLEFAATPDPRHDTWDVVEFDQTFYREVAWTLPLSATGTMTHRLTRSDFPT